MFREALQSVVDGTEGGVAGLLMGYDGIPVDQYVRDDAAIEVETVGMEYSVILKSIMNATEMLDAGSAREVTVKAEKMTTVIRFINEEYFVAVAIRPDGNSGKARFKLRTIADQLAADLS
jgi:predicted regulator of Ras-like GTPase activity (Roadblock/LC7/MglB family)